MKFWPKSMLRYSALNTYKTIRKRIISAIWGLPFKLLIRKRQQLHEIKLNNPSWDSILSSCWAITFISKSLHKTFTCITCNPWEADTSPLFYEAFTMHSSTSITVHALLVSWSTNQSHSQQRNGLQVLAHVNIYMNGDTHAKPEERRSKRERIK